MSDINSYVLIAHWLCLGCALIMSWLCLGCASWLGEEQRKGPANNATSGLTLSGSSQKWSRGSSEGRQVANLAMRRAIATRPQRAQILALGTG